MRSWYDRIASDPADLSPVLDAIDYFNAQYSEGREETDRLKGNRLIEVQGRLPGMVGFRCEQMHELDAIVGYLEIRETAVLGARRRHYLEHYNRQLSDRMVEKYAESHDDVI